MMILLTYDVDFSRAKGEKRLRKVARLCERYGVRVQKSVFEMVLDPAQLVKLKADLKAIIDNDLDSVRIYRLGSKWDNKIETLGAQKGFEQLEPLML